MVPQREGGRPADRSPFAVARVLGALAALPQRLMILLIRAYQLTLSPLLPPSCRFSPSCSQYTLEAVRRYGALKGFWLGARRLARCHPYRRGGFDPVP